MIRGPAADADRRAALEEAWAILYLALESAFSRQSRQAGGSSLRPEDLEDLVSDKALDLWLRLESGEWNLEGRHEGEIVRFFATVARNGVVDRLRTSGRTRTEEPEVLDRSVDPRHRERSPATKVDRGQFAQALEECARRLSDRDRTVWFFRVFYELSSRDIASHPEVDLKPSHVDVLLQRCRRSVSECLRRKGWNSGDLPPGTFATLWAAFRRTPRPEELR